MARFRYFSASPVLPTAAIKSSHQEVVGTDISRLGEQPGIVDIVIYLLIDAGVIVICYRSPDQALNLKFKLPLREEFVLW